MEKRKQEIILSVIFLGIVVFFGLNTELYSARIDITENQYFSIHPVSREILSQLPEQVTITYYFTSKLKGVNVVYRQIEDILTSYAAASGGTIELRFVDPIRDNQTQAAREFQITQFKEDVQDSPDEANVFLAYSGIVIQYLERYRVFPQVRSVDTLEYDLTSTIHNLLTGETPRVGILIDKDDFNQQQFGSVARWLQQYFEIEPVQKGQEISAEIDTLVVIGGGSLTEADLYPIDQFIMNGGYAIFFTEGVMVNAEYGVAFPSPDVPLLSMLKAYGVTVAPALVMENARDSFNVQNQPYHYWFRSYREDANQDNPITKRLLIANFFWASPLSLNAPEGVTGEKLINTTPGAVKATDQLPIQPNEVAMAYSALRAEQESMPLAVAVSGRFPSFFRDKPVPDAEGKPKEGASPVTLSDDNRIIVVGDADFISPRFLAYTQYANLDFFINSLVWLSDNSNLLEIRTRSQQNVYMSKIQNPDDRQAVIYTIIVINIFVIPLGVILFGIVKYLMRKKKQPQKPAANTPQE